MWAPGGPGPARRPVAGQGCGELASGRAAMLPQQGPMASGLGVLKWASWAVGGWGRRWERPAGVLRALTGSSATFIRGLLQGGR